MTFKGCMSQLGDIAIPFYSCDFLFNDPATTEIYTLSLHDALPIYAGAGAAQRSRPLPQQRAPAARPRVGPDRKSTRLNSSHDQISYAVFGLKKKIGMDLEKLTHESFVSKSNTVFKKAKRRLLRCTVVCLFFFLMIRPPPTSTLFPYTTLFRSARSLNFATLRRPVSLRFSRYSHSSSMSRRSEEHTSELQSRSDLVCRLLLE